MAQRPTRGNAPAQKQHTVPHEEDTAQKSQEKPQGQGAIAVVRSKIREKDAQEEEDPLASAKVTPSKIASKPKRPKRGSSSENIVNDPAAIKKSDIKPEKIDTKLEEGNTKPEADSKLETGLIPEDNQTVITQIKSKKSIARIVPSRKSLGPREDDQSENISAKKSEVKKGMESFISTGPALSSTALPVSELQEQKPENQTLVKNIQSDFSQSPVKKSTSKSLPSQKTHAERKNYLANISPEPLDEYPADEDEPKELKDQEKPNKKNDSIS